MVKSVRLGGFLILCVVFMSCSGYGQRSVSPQMTSESSAAATECRNQAI